MNPVLAVVVSVATYAAATLLGCWYGMWRTRRVHAASNEVTDLLHQVAMDAMWQQGRQYGQHEPHECDPDCLNWALTLLTRTTSNDPSQN